MTKLIGSIAALSLIIVAFIIGNAHEDSPLFNCYVSGNHQCGPDPGTIGFIYWA